MDHDNSFTHEGHLYSLDKIRILVRSQPMFLLRLKDLLWVLRFDTPSEERISKAKHRYPLLVAKTHDGKWAVVDGLHRLEKYRRKGVTSVPVKEVTREMLRRALLIHKR